MSETPEKILVIQTAFIGDVILATALLEELHSAFPLAQLDFMVRKGNEGLLKEHPYLNEVLVWNKKEGKFKNLWKLLGEIRRRKYDAVLNLQRFASTGFLTLFSGAKRKAMFDKNPLAAFANTTATHLFAEHPEDEIHEVERNQALLYQTFPQLKKKKVLPKLYPTPTDIEKASQWQNEPYITISPFSVWPTKELPIEKWVQFINEVDFAGNIFLLGGPGEVAGSEKIVQQSKNPKLNNLTGKLGLLPSVALMEKAILNYVNDSAPLHLCSASNAPVCAVFCSTAPHFGFGPISDFARVIEVKEPLSCKPCGIHGKKKCPLGHFKCGKNINVQQLIYTLKEAEKRISSNR